MSLTTPHSGVRRYGTDNGGGVMLTGGRIPGGVMRSNRWHHGQGVSKTLSQTPRKAPTKPISTLPPQRHLTHPTSLRHQQHWSRNAHQSSTHHAPPPPPPTPPRNHTSSPQVSQPTSSSFTERQHG